MWKGCPSWLNEALLTVVQDAGCSNTAELLWWLANTALDSDADKLVPGKSCQELSAGVMDIYLTVYPNPGVDDFCKEFLMQCAFDPETKKVKSLYALRSTELGTKEKEAITNLFNCNLVQISAYVTKIIWKN